MDAVIAWVDGNDPSFRKRLNEYGSPKALKREDVGGRTRYASVGEIFWCVVSLNRFAPFIDRIFIITDGQDPELGGQLRKYFPDGGIPITIVDHKEIFRGYEEYLPVFNSRAIETMMWRVPGLSERFIYLNDDFMLCSQVTPEAFFTPDGCPVCYAEKYGTLKTKILNELKPEKGGQKKVSYKASMLAAAEMLGCGPYILKINHTPRPLLKSFYEEYYSARPEAIVRNISHRFRDSSQYNTQELFYLSKYREGKCVLRSVRKHLFYFEPKKKPEYLELKMLKFNIHNYEFVCFNSLDKATPDDLSKIELWINQRLGL